jgi:hypothetical protein
MELSVALHDAPPTDAWRLAQQMGLSTAVGTLPREADAPPWSFEPLLELENRYSDNGLDLRVIEDRPPLDDAILGRPGRDEQIETHLDRCRIALAERPTDRLIVVGERTVLDEFDDDADVTATVSATGDPEPALEDAFAEFWTVRLRTV